MRAKTREFDMPTAERVERELATIKSPDDFFGEDGVFSKLFAKTINQMLKAEMDEHLGYAKHSPAGHLTGNTRNGNYDRKLKTSAGELDIEVPRDRKGQFQPQIIDRYQTRTSEFDNKIIAMYGHGTTAGDISDSIRDMYGIELSKDMVSNITDKILPVVNEWRTRPLDEVYVIAYMDCIHIKLRRDGKVVNTAVYVCLGVDLEGKKDVLGHWIGEGGEGANFWLTVVSDLQNRGVKDILIACVDGLVGFKDAINAVFPDTVVQRCIIHQIRSSLKYINWKDRKEFVNDLRTVYKAATKAEAEINFEKINEKWKGSYAIALKGWKDNWEELTQYFDYSPEIRKLIYTTNAVEGYNRMLRKVTKSKAVFPTENSVFKMFYLATKNILKKWTMPIPDWGKLLSQLSIRFEGRLPL
jgi:transposase-like protein